jgi:hypothetical protein
MKHALEIVQRNIHNTTQVLEVKGWMTGDDAAFGSNKDTGCGGVEKVYEGITVKKV